MGLDPVPDPAAVRNRVEIQLGRAKRDVQADTVLPGLAHPPVDQRQPFPPRDCDLAKRALGPRSTVLPGPVRGRVQLDFGA